MKRVRVERSSVGETKRERRHAEWIAVSRGDGFVVCTFDVVKIMKAIEPVLREVEVLC